jgi:hypothetical protein
MKHRMEMWMSGNAFSIHHPLCFCRPIYCHICAGELFFLVSLVRFPHCGRAKERALKGIGRKTYI